MSKVKEFILANWDDCIRETRQDTDTIIGLPYPYTVPSKNAFNAFNELYYWDTYFTNIGLLKTDREIQAKNNTDNMLYLVNKYGFMPNGNRTYFLNRSQPPFLVEAVYDIYSFYKDDVWLTGAYNTLKKEYTYWMTKRITPIGLNRYDCVLSPDEIESSALMFKERVKCDIHIDDALFARHGMTTAESGWDMNPRWGFEGYNYAHIDLNSLLFLFEKRMAYYAEVLRNNEERLWRSRMEKRQELMNKYMLNKDNLFFDYHLRNGKHSNIFSVASLYPLYVGVATKEQAAVAVSNLYRLEAKYGVVCCEKNDCYIQYQWDYPNGWACLQYITIKALENYGYIDEAKRIAQKYISLVEKIFDETGTLWEKYNVVDGNILVQDEYKMPTMLGWSAGVYIALLDF